MRAKASNFADSVADEHDKRPLAKNTSSNLLANWASSGYADTALKRTAKSSEGDWQTLI